MRGTLWMIILISVAMVGHTGPEHPFLGGTYMQDPPDTSDSTSGSDTLAVDTVEVVNYDSLFAIPPQFVLSPEFYKNRYKEKDLMYKVTDNHGDGFDSLYGTRNLRPILHGVAYRGGSNNYFHRDGRIPNQNPLPDDGQMNLCQEGFSKIVYLYRNNFEGTFGDTCSCVNGAYNATDYVQKDYHDDAHIKEMLGYVYEAATNEDVGPVYLHCWNGWHASGLLSALTLRQFCGMDKWQAINYWDLGTDGANMSPRYQKIRETIKNFEPYPEYMISDSLKECLCPDMPEKIDSSELHIEIEHLAVVPEAIPVGFSIVLYNVNFGAGKSYFSNPSSNKDMQFLLKALKEQSELTIEIGGFTDNTGSYSKNVAISRDRAKFVYDWLVKQGIEASRLTYKGYGPAKPIYSNRYKSTRAGNRRIEVKVLTKHMDDLNKLVDDGTGSDASPQNPLVREVLKFSQVKEGFPSNSVDYFTLDSLNFAPYSDTPTMESRPVLDMLVELMKSNPTVQIEVGGHTDNSGLDSTNQALSLRRAVAVRQYLEENGVTTQRIECKGYGSEQPIAPNNKEWGREMNRRIDIRVLRK